MNIMKMIKLSLKKSTRMNFQLLCLCEKREPAKLNNATSKTQGKTASTAFNANGAIKKPRLVGAISVSICIIQHSHGNVRALRIPSPLSFKMTSNSLTKMSWRKKETKSWTMLQSLQSWHLHASLPTSTCSRSTKMPSRTPRKRVSR